MTKRIKILVDGKPLSTGAGVGKHLHRILVNLSKNADVTVVLTGKPLYDISSMKHVKFRKAFARGVAGRLVYEQIIIPLTALLGGFGILYSPKSYIPFIKTCRTVATMHDDIPASRKGRESVLTRLYWKITFANTLRSSDGIIFINEEVERNFLAKHGFLSGKRRRVIHNGWDSYENIKNEKRSIILLPQTLKKRKRMELSIKLAVLLKEKTGAERVLVTGRNEMKRFHEDAKNAFEYAGYLSEEDMALCFSRALLVVYLSDAEGYSLPIAEALHAGAEVVAADTPLNRNLYGDMPIYYNENETTERNAERIIKLLEKGREIKDEKKERTWREAAEQTELFFESFC